MKKIIRISFLDFLLGHAIPRKKNPIPGIIKPRDILKTKVSKKFRTLEIKSRELGKNSGEKNPEIKKNPETRGLKS